MGWVKVDDHLHSNPKVRRAWQADPAAVGLYVLALSYAGDYLTDGAVGQAFVCDQLPVAPRRRRAVKALVDAGLWERNGSAWLIHDYLKFNESREQAIDRRKRDAERKRAGFQ